LDINLYVWQYCSNIRSNIFKLKCFGAELIENQSYKYNSHGYAWNVAEGGNKVWIGRYTITAEDIYWTDGSYIPVDESDATKVSYHQDGNHSAIKLDNTLYQSKWGWGGGLVKHKLNDVDPIYEPSKTKTFYKKNSTPIISGPDVISSNSVSTYTLSTIPPTIHVSWSVSPVLSIVSSSGDRKLF